MTTKPFPHHVRDRLAQAIFKRPYEQLIGWRKDLVDKETQSIVEAAVGCVGYDLICHALSCESSSGLCTCDVDAENIVKAEIRAKLRGEEQA